MDAGRAMTRLAALLQCSAAAAGLDIRLVVASYGEWSSSTFDGTVQRFTFDGSVEPELLDEWAVGLASAEFSIPGQLVADICWCGTGVAADGMATVEIEALLIEEAAGADAIAPRLSVRTSSFADRPAATGADRRGAAQLAASIRPAPSSAMEI